MIMVDVSPSTSNRESFPAGLKVLVVDDDPLTLKVVGHMLKRCQYEGTCRFACACPSPFISANFSGVYVICASVLSYGLMMIGLLFLACSNYMLQRERGTGNSSRQVTSI